MKPEKAKKTKTKIEGRILPPNHRFVMTLESIRTYTFLERLQILVGYSTKTLMQVAMEHSPGKFDASPCTIVTKDLLAKFTGDVTREEEPPF